MTVRKITQMYIAIYVLAYTKLWIIYGKCNVKFQKLNHSNKYKCRYIYEQRKFQNIQILWTKKFPIFPNIMNKKNSRYYEHKCFKIFEQTAIPMNSLQENLKFTIFYLFFLMCILFRKLFFILTCRTNVSTNFQHGFIINVLCPRCASKQMYASIVEEMARPYRHIYVH